MMKGGGRFSGGGGLATREPPLIQLVEKYLADNSNLSYINIDDMIDYFQGQYYRFARMQRKVFANQVRSAYFDYCRRNTNGNGKQAESNAPQLPNTDRSDSDIEEIEEDAYTPKNDFVNANVSNLYKASTAKANFPKTSGNVQEPQNMLEFPTSTVQLAGGSGGTNATVTAVAVTTTHSSSDVATDSDDDLEIIDEVQGRNVIQKVIDSPIGQNDGSTASSSTTTNSVIPSGITLTIVSQEGGAGNRLVAVAPPASRSNTSLKNPTTLPSSSSIVLGKVDKISTPLRPLRTIGNNGSLASSSIEQRRKQVMDHTRTNSSFNSAIPQQRGTKRKNSSSDNQGLRDDLTTKKLKKEVTIVGDTGYRLADFAGSEKVVEEVCRLLMHLKHPEVYKTLGVNAPRGFLLHGPPGVGKTLLANAISGELQLPMLKVTGTEFVSGISGESESNIRDLFNQAISIAPCIIFIDEIDSITPKRETVQKEMERRIVAQLLSCIDDLMNQENGGQVLLIGATNRIEAIDTALRRAGRFDKEICLGIPDEKSRQRILEVICRNLRLAPGFDLGTLAKLTPGYVGADLQLLVREAAVQAVNKALMDTTQKRLQVDSKNNKKKAEAEVQVESVLISPKDPTIVPIAESRTETSVVEESVCDDDKKTTEPVVPIEPSKQDAPPPTETSVTEVPDSTNVDAPNVNTDDTVENPEVMDIEAEEKMEVDVDKPLHSASIDASIEVVEKSGETQNQQDDVGTTSQLLDKVEDEEPEHEPEAEPETAPYLRWIKETAPLSPSQLDELYIFIDDFEEALKHVQPSSKREGFATVPDTTWDDIGALADIREELEVSILGPVKYSRAYETLGLMNPAGVLLCGPPGCGKTLLAKAVAHEAGINFISVKGPELLNMYVGESERAVRQCFIRAKNSSPCVIFFDEIDALCPRRSDAPESGSGSRIVNQLLTEMDGVEGRQGVFIMAATNRPDILDPAILRPGRLDKLLFVDLPSTNDRHDILKAITKNGTNPVLSSDVDLKAISERECCDNYTGADLAALVREASVAAFKDLVMNKSQDSVSLTDLKVSMRHFEVALLKTKPSVTKDERDKYAKMKERYSSITGQR